MDEGRLLSRVKHDDRQAFAELYELIAGRTYGLIRSILVDPAQSEEVFQEVMLEVWTHASRFDPEKGSAVAWIATIARRRAVDRVRSEQASRRRGRDAVCMKEPPPHDGVADRIVVTDEWRTVTTALQGLSALQREAIELAYYGELTYREVAERLQVPIGTVKAHIRMGMSVLRRELAATWSGSVFGPQAAAHVRSAS